MTSVTSCHGIPREPANPRSYEKKRLKKFGIEWDRFKYTRLGDGSHHARARKRQRSYPGIGQLGKDPTVIHEVYHSLVFKRKMMPVDVRTKLIAFIGDRRSRFLTITRSVTLYSVELAVKFNMGGRDSLIVGCFMHNRVEMLLTHDRQLLQLRRIDHRGKEISFSDPLAA